MVGRLWELCANQCPAEHPCHENASAQVRHEWDRRAAAKSEGREPFPHLQYKRCGLGDAVYHAAYYTGLAWLFGKNHCAACNARRRWLNELPGRIWQGLFHS